MGRLAGDPSGAAAQKLIEVSRSLNGTSFRNLPLGFPRGKLLSVARLMRGGDRLVSGCSWMNGVCFGFHHSTY